jgi:hypothetical protein
MYGFKGIYAGRFIKIIIKATEVGYGTLACYYLVLIG